MRKHLLAITLELTLCLGLCAIPAFATDIKNATAEDIRSTFTIIRNGTIDETEGRYRSSQPVLVDDTGNLEPGQIYYYVFDKNDSWTITNTGSNAISASGRTDYQIQFTTWSYGNIAGEGYQWVGGTSFVTADGQIVHVPSEDTKIAVLKPGESVTISASAMEGEGPYEGPYDGRGTIHAISVIINYGSPELIDDDNYVQYTFYFLGDSAQKAAIDKQHTNSKPNSSILTFTDVSPNAWYAAPVAWAVGKDITNGTSDTTFSPGQDCTQAQILTFLYRAFRGQGVASASDMDLAVEWAKEKGIIDGTFDRGKPCTRAIAVSYIWQAFGKPEAEKGTFTDVPSGADYVDAVSWAVAIGITNGDGSETVFSPDKVCNRSQIVTFLQRAYVEEARLTTK